AILSHIPKNESYDFSKDLFPRLLSLQQPLYGYIAKGYWKDVGDLAEYRLAHYDLLENWPQTVLLGRHHKRGESDVTYGEGTHLDTHVGCEGKIVLGKGCRIEDGAKLTRCVIGNRVTVRSGAQVSGSVLWDDITVGKNAQIEE